MLVWFVIFLCEYELKFNIKINTGKWDVEIPEWVITSILVVGNLLLAWSSSLWYIHIVLAVWMMTFVVKEFKMWKNEEDY